VSFFLLLLQGLSEIVKNAAILTGADLAESGPVGSDPAGSDSAEDGVEGRSNPPSEIG
jgi:hypothetical protein